MLIAAQAVLLLHLAFVLFAVLGSALVWWRRHFIWLHLPALAWGVWIELTQGFCPLTTLENQLLRAAGESGYGGGFIEQYLIPLLYPPGLQPAHQLWLAAFLIVINVIGYGLVIHRHRRHPRHV
ncbi:MAG: DUF2784 domain-containing protein [Pseudomonadota bacterium]